VHYWWQRNPSVAARSLPEHKNMERDIVKGDNNPIKTVLLEFSVALQTKCVRWAAMIVKFRIYYVS
jgi:hypothetical protein